MAIAFSGSRRTPLGTAAFISSVLDTLSRDELLVSGGCVGVDELVACLGRQLGFRNHLILPFDRSRVFEGWEPFADQLTELPSSREPYRDRNTALVKAASRLIAFPFGPEDDPGERRSGTWMTVRIARKLSVPVETHLLSKELHRAV